VYLAAAPAAAQRVEERFSERASSSILLVYDGRRIEPGTERVLLGALERTYADLVQDLGSAPADKVTVVVYAEGDFGSATRAPDWSGGLFDGKVRVPAQGLTGVTPALLALLKHEMAHAFVWARTRGRTPRWLNEGIAQLEEGRTSGPWTGALLDLWKSNGSFGLRALEGSFRGLSGAQVRAAYPVSLAATEMLRETRGPGALTRLLDRLGEGTPLEEAMRETVRTDTTGVESELAEWLARRPR
jgi:hypothetical protein